MNLTDIDLTAAKPIDFDDIREGDTFVYADDCEIVIANAVRKGMTMAHGGWIATGPNENDRNFYPDPEARWFLLSRPTPPRVEPGTTGTATVLGQEGVRVMCTAWPLLWATAVPLAGAVLFSDVDVTDFVPDPAPGIPQELGLAVGALNDALARDDLALVVTEARRVVDEYADAEARDV